MKNKIKAWIKEREEGILFIIFLIIIFPLAYILYILSYILFPEGTLGP